MEETSKKKLDKTLDIIQWVLIIVFYLYFNLQANAQSVAGEAYVQKSIIGIQKGYEFKFVGKKGFGYGVFHQSTDVTSFEAKGNNYPFTGIELEVPIKRCGNLQVSGSLKGGFVNEHFLVVTPEITTKMNFGKFLAVGLGTGYRAGQSSVALKVILKTSL